MFIKKVTIKNFRLFPTERNFELNNLNIPDGTNEGSGLNVFVGENGSGKTALLDAFVLPILEHKSENFAIDNFNRIDEKIEICIYSDKPFEVTGTMPKGSFLAKGFKYEAGVRSRGNKGYLSSIVVNDQKFIQVDPTKPAENSPDLRVNVNNPFKGKRFNENDILFLDKSRIFQTRTGNFSPTRFDRLMEDFNFQYIKNSVIENLNEDLDMKIKKDKVENEFLYKAIQKFQDFSGSQIRLDFLNNYEPFKHAFFATKKANHQQISLNDLGSGNEMIFCLIYSFFLAKQSGKQLIVLIDEPELHLHPVLQEKFVEFLLEFSKDVQIIITSHSSLLIKQLSFNDKLKISIIKNGEVVSEIGKRVLPYVSANETNFLAFSLASEEYHNELFEELKFINGDKKIKDFDNDFFVGLKGEQKDSPYLGVSNEVSVHTFIRNQIHHQKDNGNTKYQDLKSSIEKMRTYF